MATFLSKSNSRLISSLSSHHKSATMKPLSSLSLSRPWSSSSMVNKVSAPTSATTATSTAFTTVRRLFTKPNSHSLTKSRTSSPLFQQSRRAVDVRPVTSDDEKNKTQFWEFTVEKDKTSCTERTFRRLLLISDEDMEETMRSGIRPYPEPGTPVTVFFNDQNGTEQETYAVVLPNILESNPSGFSADLSSLKAVPAEPPQVKLNIMDQEGHLHEVGAWEGETLLDVCKRAKMPMPAVCRGGSSSEEDQGEGAMCSFCHCQIASEYLHKLPPQSASEKKFLSPNSEIIGVTRNSRLACRIPVTKDLNGMSLAIPKYPDSGFM